jgi:uncharacterized membrane protein
MRLDKPTSIPQSARVGAIALLCTLAMGALVCAPALAAARGPIEASGRVTGPAGGAGQGANGSSLESAAAKAGNTGRAVAMSLIGLAFAVAGTVLAFRRDFKEAAGVFAVGIVAVLLATPTGVTLLRDTVNSLFGSS